LAGTCSTLFSQSSGWLCFLAGSNYNQKKLRPKKKKSKNTPPENNVVPVPAKIWRELAQYYFLADCFGGSSDLAGTGSTLFSGGLFWRQLRFRGNWLLIIFQRIVLEAAQIWQELALHYFLADCFGGGSDLAGIGSTLFSGRLFWRQLRFGENWLQIIFCRIVLEAAQIWRELAPHYFPDVNAVIFLPGYIPQGVMVDGLSTRVQ
jgi:hypothetical protein